MGIKVYYSEISAQKEVKKRQQKVMMILESKIIPYEAIDITEAGRESDKDFMLTTAKTRGDAKTVVSPQIFNDETYCGDYDDFELANENDELEKFLNIEKAASNVPTITNGNQNGAVNGASRESSAEKEGKVEESNANETTTEDNPPQEEEEPMSTTEAVPEKEPPAKEESLDDIQPEVQAEEEEEEEEDE